MCSTRFCASVRDAQVAYQVNAYSPDRHSHSCARTAPCHAVLAHREPPVRTSYRIRRKWNTFRLLHTIAQSGHRTNGLTRAMAIPIRRVRPLTSGPHVQAWLSWSEKGLLIPGLGRRFDSA